MAFTRVIGARGRQRGSVVKVGLGGVEVRVGLVVDRWRLRHGHVRRGRGDPE